MDLTKTTYYLVGIKGVAMASLAQCLVDMGKTVFGSDVSEDFVTKDVLHKLAIPIHDGFDPSHITSVIDSVVYTGAHQGSNNPQVLQAIAQGIPVYSHAEALGALMEGKRGISVCGTGGKSTTSSMIAWILEYANLRPSFSIGVGNVLNFGVTGQVVDQDEPGWFVAEADEYAVDPTKDKRPRFTYQFPEISVCTNLTYDHPDVYPTFDDMVATFYTFFATNTKECVVLNGDSPTLLSLAQRLANEKTSAKIVSVGVHEQSAARIHPPYIEHGQFCAVLEYQDQSMTIALQFPGLHNMRNAAMAAVTCMHIGVPVGAIINALKEYKGTMRRFESHGLIKGVECFDDYAHTPEELVATIEALRSFRPDKKILLAFQPHTFSRTRALFDGFVSSLALADKLLLVDIFPSAREAVDSSFSSAIILAAIQQKNTEYNGYVVGTVKDLASQLPDHLDSDYVLLTAGAGDIYTVYSALNGASI